MRTRFATITLLALCCCTSAPSYAQISSPEEVVGFKVGEDRKLFGWETIVDYFRMLHEKSDRVTVKELGQTTLGRPFIMAIISSRDNLLNLAKYKNLQKQAANPRHLSDEDARLLARQNKLVVMITLNVHATEVASSQESVELAFRLATGRSPEVQRILDNVIILLIPSMNPDGLQKVVDWYEQYLETPHEGSVPPYLSHTYAGADNDRDAFMMNLVETKLLAKQTYEEWFPEIVYEQQETQPGGPRLVLPPYLDPHNSNLHPLVLAQLNKIGKHVASDLQAQGMKGIATDAVVTKWSLGRSGFTPWWHNMLGVVSAVAGAQLATPLYFPPGSLNRNRRDFDVAGREMNVLEPWPGGWWHLRDAVDYHLATTFSLLDLAAREKESIIYNFCKMNLDAIEKGKTEPPFAFVVPRHDQHDPITARKMLDILSRGGVEIHQAEADFWAGNRQFKRGDYVILLSQPFRAYVKALLEHKPYPEWTAVLEKAPVPPGDVTGWTLPLMMGVNCVRIDTPFEVELGSVNSPRPQRAKVLRRRGGDYLVRHRTNRSFILLNRLLQEGKKVYWLRDTLELRGSTYAPGTIYIPLKQIDPNKMSFLAQELAVTVEQRAATARPRDHDALSETRPLKGFRLKPPRIALYQPWTANVDEGWTRFLLEQFEFRYQSLYNARIRKGGLQGDFDAIILPDMPPEEILSGRATPEPDIYTPRPPKPYLRGVGEEGVKALQEFVRKGGTLIALGSACDFAIERLGLPAQDVTKNASAAEFFCPGSLLRVVVDPTEPLAYGMPDNAAVMFTNGPVLRPKYWARRTGVPALYPEEDPLLSGVLLGGETLQGLAALLDIPMGKGRVVLIGFRTQYRGQTHGTFKFLFNALFLSRAEKVVIKK